MITLSQFRAHPCFTGIQREKKDNSEIKTVLKQLNIDTVSFSSLFSKKPARPEHVTKEAYDVVSKYVEDNPRTYAGCFMEQIKLMCEQGSQLNLEENAEIYAREVEKEKIEEVSKILMKVKASILPSSLDRGVLIKEMDRFKNTLGKPLN